MNFDNQPMKFRAHSLLKRTPQLGFLECGCLALRNPIQPIAPFDYQCLYPLAASSVGKMEVGKSDLCLFSNIQLDLVNKLGNTIQVLHLLIKIKLLQACQMEANL